VQKTWTNFKIHFREAHQQLRKTTSLQRQKSSYRANAVQEFIVELKNELRQQQNIDCPPSVTPHTPNISTVSSADTATTISALQSEVSSLRQLVQHMTAHPITDSSQSMPMAQRPYMPYPPMFCNQMAPPQVMAPVNNQPPSVQQQQKRKRIFYCWTHGSCYHSSDRCLNKAPGHQDTSIFRNRMDGSTKNVRNVHANNDTQTNT